MLVEIVFLAAPQINKDDYVNKIFMLIFVTKNLKSIFRPEYKSKIIPLLACILDSKLLKDCPGVYHTYTALFEFIADNCLDFLVNDICTMHLFMDECTFTEKSGVD